MKRLTVKHVAASETKAAHIPALLDKADIAFEKIATVNWEEFPYQPDVEFRIASTDDALLLHYRVEEASVRAVAGADNGPVWEDACVEFFSIPGGDGIYYNMECNCAGRLLIGAGAGREGREHAPKEALEQVDRWCSLGREDFEERIGQQTWEVALLIPYTAFFKHQLTNLQGQCIRANFYKCGDKLQTPHFLSWNGIALPKPNFHCPDFFGELMFE